MLLTTRPEGKVYAGYWEFPGGKLEAGETVEAGAAARAARGDRHHDRRRSIWQVTEHDYPHALVRLHWCKVTQWAGEFEMREGQAMCWQQLPLDVAPVLPGALPVLGWLAEERGLAFEPPAAQGLLYAWDRRTDRRPAAHRRAS